MTEEVFATIKEHANGRGQFDAYIIRRELGILAAEVERLRKEVERLRLQTATIDDDKFLFNINLSTEYAIRFDPTTGKITDAEQL